MSTYDGMSDAERAAYEDSGRAATHRERAAMYEAAMAKSAADSNFEKPEQCPWCGYWVEAPLSLHIEHQHADEEEQAARWERLITEVIKTRGESHE